MELIRLSEDNISEYAQTIPEDIAENIGRTYYRGIVGTEGGTPVAGIIWLIQNTMSDEKRKSHIVWLYLAEDEYAGELFDEYKKMVENEKVTSSSFALPARSGKALKPVLKANGFTVSLMEGDEIVARISEIAEIGFLKKIPATDDVKPLRSITQRGFNLAVRRMMTRGYYGLCEDIEYLPRMFFENDVSCYIERDGVISGLFLCHKTASGRLKVELMAAVGKDYVKMLPMLLAGAYRSASSLYPPETEVVIDRHNYASLALGEKLFPRGFGIPMYIGSRTETA